MSTTSSARSGNASSTCCDNTARVRASSSAPNAVTGRSPYRTSPADGRSRPVATRSSVDLPAPLGPRMTLNLHASKRAVTSSRMRGPFGPPTRYVTPFTSTIESGARARLDTRSRAALRLLAEQDPQENRRTNHRRDDADGQLGRRNDDARDDVYQLHEHRAQQRGAG